MSDGAAPVRWAVTVGSGCIGSGSCLATAPSYFVSMSASMSFRKPCLDRVSRLDTNESVFSHPT